MFEYSLKQPLQKLSRKTKTDLVYLLGHSGWLLSGQVAIFGSSLALVWFFANYIEPASYGLYKYVLVLATIATTTSLTGYGIAVARALSQGYNVNLWRLLKVRFLAGTVGATFFVSIGLYYWYLGNTLLANTILAVALFIPFYETLSDYQFILQGKVDFKRQALTRTLQRCLLVTGVIVAILVTHNIIIITFTFFAVSTLSQASLLWYTLKTYPTRNDGNTPYRNITRQGNHLSLQNMFTMTVGQLDKILLFKFLGPVALAGYFFAIAIPQEIFGFVGNLSSVTFPKLTDRTTPEFRKPFLKKIFLLSLLLSIPVTLYIFTAPYLFSWLFPLYLDTVFISQLFAGTIVFAPLFFFTQYFYATENTEATWALSTISPLLYLASLCWLAPSYGLCGVVMATYLRYSSDTLLSIFFLFKTELQKGKI